MFLKRQGQPNYSYESDSPEEVKISQFLPLAMPLLKTDGVKGGGALIFLGKATDLGFDPIIGERAGYFRVVDDEANPDLIMVENLLGNLRLWADALWSSAFIKEAFRARLEDFADRGTIEDGTVNYILEEYASKPCRPRPIPLALLHAAILSHSSSAP